MFVLGLCLTESGDACSFPFYYGGIRYNNCTTVGDINNRHWCSISTDDFGQHQAGTESWGYCQIQSTTSCFNNQNI